MGIGENGDRGEWGKERMRNGEREEWGIEFKKL